jgi:hypothetical protein
MKRTDEKFAEEAKALFDDSVERLDAATLSTLNRNRHAALERARGAKARWLQWAPASAVAAAIVVALVLALPGNGVDTMPAANSDVDILLGEESIEMLEDLEFYVWLDMQEDDVG